MCSIWELIRKRIIGKHEIQLHGRTVDGVDRFRICVDSCEKLRGTKRECEGGWRHWVRFLNKIAREPRPLTLEQIDLKRSPLGITLGL